MIAVTRHQLSSIANKYFLQLKVDQDSFFEAQESLLCFSVYYIFKISLRELKSVFNLIARDLDANITRALKTSNRKKMRLDTIVRLLSKTVYKQYKTIEFSIITVHIKYLYIFR